MKHLLLTTIAAVLLVGCGPSVGIHQAAYDGDIQVVKYHLADGADVNAKDNGWTPLHHAAARGHKEIVELLIAAGADVNPKNNFLPLDGAISYKHTDIANLLRKHGGKTGEELRAEGK